MNCRDVIDKLIVEKYVAGKIAEPEREEFERHYFECGACARLVDTLLAAQAVLEHDATKFVTNAHVRTRRVWFRWLVPAAALAAGAAVVALLVVHPTLPGNSQSAAQALRQPRGSEHPPSGPATASERAPAPALAELARLEAPGWRAPLLRGPEPSAPLMKARREYTAGRYEAAIVALRPLADRDQSAEAKFYLGICYLMRGRLHDAKSWLAAVADMGETSYREAAHFYLAKTYLREGDARKAAAQLDETVALHGDFERQAARLRERLTAVAP